MYHMDHMDSVADASSNSQVSMETTEKPVKQHDLSETVIDSENTALNVLISFVYLAQKRGAYNLKEAAKIWECVQRFIKE